MQWQYPAAPGTTCGTLKQHSTFNRVKECAERVFMVLPDAVAVSGSPWDHLQQQSSQQPCKQTCNCWCMRTDGSDRLHRWNFKSAARTILRPQTWVYPKSGFEIGELTSPGTILQRNEAARHNEQCQEMCRGYCRVVARCSGCIRQPMGPPETHQQANRQAWRRLLPLQRLVQVLTQSAQLISKCPTHLQTWPVPASPPLPRVVGQVPKLSVIRAGRSAISGCVPHDPHLMLP
jgi:hypothetical protein